MSEPVVDDTAPDVEPARARTSSISKEASSNRGNTSPVSKAADVETKVVSLPPLSVTSLVGLDQHQVQEELGPASSIAERPPAIVWAYEDKGCTLELHFYLEVKQRNYLVLTTNVIGPARTKQSDQTCLDSIRAQRLNSKTN